MESISNKTFNIKLIQFTIYATDNSLQLVFPSQIVVGAAVVKDSQISLPVPTTQDKSVRTVRGEFYLHRCAWLME